MGDNPVVFISYSQDSISFSNQVLAFSNKLRSEGIDAVLDQYEEAPAEGWPMWTEKQIRESDFVIVICSQGYFNKINGAVDDGQGRGVKWEVNIIYQALYSEDSNNKKFIPVGFNDSDCNYIPSPLQGSSYYNISEYNSYKKLYWRLRGFNAKERPPLGKLRSLPQKERKTLMNIESSGSITFTSELQRLILWLTKIECKWGVLDSSTEKQHANTCEGLLAMKMSGYDRNKKSIYSHIWSQLYQESTENGLTSKSLGKETVVCTSLLLILAAMEKDNLSDSEKEHFEKMAKKLWDVHNDDYGWGIYVSKTEDSFCSYANTAWALRALYEYKNIRSRKDYQEFCHRIFESALDGHFSFFAGGQPKLMVTALYLGLYYRMDDSWKMEQSSFDKTKSLNFIYEFFVEKNIQVELETLYGVNPSSLGPKKVPWNHITVWPVLDVLSIAHRNGDLESTRWHKLLFHVKRIIDSNVRVAGNMVCYHPAGMEESRNGHFTFPTSYLVMGLSQL